MYMPRVTEAEEVARWRSRQFESSLQRKLRSMGDVAFSDAESQIALRQVTALVGCLVVVGPIAVGLLDPLFEVIPRWMFGLTLVCMVSPVVFLALTFADFIGKQFWDGFNADYERALMALQSTDLPMVIADADLRNDAYERMHIPLPPKWLRGTSEPLERHVQRAAQHFDHLRCYAIGGDIDAYFCGGFRNPMPPRTAMIALADFFLGQDSRVLRGRCKSEVEDNFDDLGEIGLKTLPGPTDIGALVRSERQSRKSSRQWPTA